MEAAGAGDVNGIDFLSSTKITYTTIQPLVKDLLAVAESQAYVEWVFSLCELMPAG